MGGDKLRRLWRGRPLLAWALDAAWTAPVDGVTLVVGADAEDVAAVARAEAQGRPLEIVEAPDWREGMSRSLRAGIAALPGDVAGAFVFLGDMPRVSAGIAAKLAGAAARSHVLAAAPVCRGVRGHPALLRRALFAQLLQVEGDRAAGPVLARLGAGLALVETDDDGVLYDVDTPDRLEA